MNEQRIRVVTRICMMFCLACIAVAVLTQAGLLLAEDKQCWTCEDPMYPPPQDCLSVIFGWTKCTVHYPGGTCSLSGDLCLLETK